MGTPFQVTIIIAQFRAECYLNVLLFGIFSQKSKYPRELVHARWVRFNFGLKARRPSCKCLSLVDFWLWGFAPPPKINFSLHPVGAFEIVAPTLKRTLGTLMVEKNLFRGKITLSY